MTATVVRGVPMLRERDWQQLVYDAARRLGWAAYHTHDSRRSTPGFPDLVLVKHGRLIFAELKTDTGAVTKPQMAWLARLGVVAGVEVYIWRPQDWPEVERILTDERRPN